MIKNEPAVKVSTDIRPNKRDFGFVLIGAALGVGVGSMLSTHYPMILIVAMGLAMTGNRLVYKSNH